MSEGDPNHSLPNHSLEEQQLAERIQQDSSADRQQAEAELYRRLAPRVRLYGLRHLRNEEAANDLMQQVMLIVIERLRAGALRESEKLVSFTFGVCRMVVLELHRGHARRERLLNAYGEVLLPPEPMLPNLDTKRLADCLEHLSERERTILLMTFYSEQSADSLAHELHLKTSNVRVIRHRGLMRLRKCVTGETE